MVQKQIFWKDLGLIDYQEGYRIQKKLFQEIITKKKLQKQGRKLTENFIPNYLLFCEHSHVYTLGRKASQEHLLVSQDFLEEKGIKVIQTNRGGDITYHGPGQLVIYPIFDLHQFTCDVSIYLRGLEKMIMSTLKGFKISTTQLKGFTGIWYQDDAIWKKICAIGIHLSYWVSMHGLALNVNTNLDYFKHIVPCGLQDKAVTSMSCILNKEQYMQTVKFSILENLQALFGVEVVKN